MRWVPGGVTAPQGFQAAGISAGIKRSRKPDLALVVCDAPATAAAVFTRNRIQAAPVVISKARMRGGAARAILINSGCANCMTGASGRQDARRISRAVARALGIADAEILLGSTGLIGTRLPVGRMMRAVPLLMNQLSRAHHEDAAQAILTTDLRVKEAAVQAVIGGRRCRLGGMAKGSGMIAPSMATMLCVLTSDVRIAPGLLRTLVRRAAARTFNRISIDGDMSTNDTVFALASGQAGAVIREGTPALATFAAMLEAVSTRLAALLVADGEGASRVMEVHVYGARTKQDAQACARQVACSPLVKTMLAGRDPNVGRVAAAAGASPARFDPERLVIHIGNCRVVSRGAALPLTKSVARRLLNRSEVLVRINLGAGRAEGRMVTCDLTEEYVRINARYAS